MSTSRTTLTRAQLRELERELLSARARLDRALLARTGADGAPGWTADGPPRAPADAEGGLAAALETRTLARHQALVAALRRLEGGTYGVCESCRAPIPYARLLVMPEATRCVACGGRA